MTRLETFKKFPIFQQLEGLAEEVIHFEAKTGISLPDIFAYTFLQVFDTEEEMMVIGKMGPFFIIALESNGHTNYELHENKTSFRLWASELFHGIQSRAEESALTEEEKQNVRENQQQFFAKIESLCEEE